MYSVKIQELKLNKKNMYFLCTMDRGNIFTTINLKNRLEKRYNTKLIFLLYKKYEFIVKLINEDAYIIVDECSSSEIVELCQKCPKPAKGKVFVADFNKHDYFDDSYHPMCVKYNHFYDLPEEEYFTYKVRIPQINDELKARVTDIAPLDKIVMLCADANSAQPLKDGFWEELAEKLKAEGFVPISSVMRQENAVKGSIYLDMNMEEALQLAYNCHAVYALRSGFCDMCIGLKEKLHVFYPNEVWYNECGFALNYNIHDIEEKVIRDCLLNMSLDNDKIYILCSTDLNEAFATMNLKDKLMAKYKSDIIFIIWGHEGFLADLISDIQYIKIHPYESMMNDIREICRKNSKPEKGKIFVSDFLAYDGFYNKFPTLCSKFNNIFKLPKNNYLTYKINTPKPAFEIESKVNSIAPYNKIILFCPEAHSKLPLKKVIWEELAKKLKAEGFIILSCVTNSKDTIPGTEYMRLFPGFVTSLAYNCHSVYSVRNEFSDLLVGLREKLTVFYPDKNCYKKYNFEKNYNIHDINEKVIE